MITAEQAEELLAAATPGPWNAATAPAEGSEETKADYIAGCHGPGCEDRPLFVAWAENTSGDDFAYLVTAIAGDGPTSGPNALLIAAAPDLAQTVIELTAKITEAQRALRHMDVAGIQTALGGDQQ